MTSLTSYGAGTIDRPLTGVAADINGDGEDELDHGHPFPRTADDDRLHGQLQPGRHGHRDHRHRHLPGRRPAPKSSPAISSLTGRARNSPFAAPACPCTSSTRSAQVSSTPRSCPPRPARSARSTTTPPPARRTALTTSSSATRPAVPARTRCWLNTGPFTAMPSSAVDEQNGTVTGFAAGDFDGDGRHDLASSSAAPGARYAEHKSTPFFDYVDAPSVVSASTNAPTVPAVGDFSDDGSDDAVVFADVASLFSYGPYDGQPAAATGTSFSLAALHPVSAAGLDYNGDGRDDIVMLGDTHLYLYRSTSLVPVQTTINSRPAALSKTNRRRSRSERTTAAATSSARLTAPPRRPAPTRRTTSAWLKVRTASRSTGPMTPTPATTTWTVDTISPDTTITSGPPSPTTNRTATFDVHQRRPVGELPVQARRRPVRRLHEPVLDRQPDRRHAHGQRPRHRPGRQLSTRPGQPHFTVDTTGPVTTLTATEPDPTNDPTGDFAFTSEPGVDDSHATSTTWRGRRAAHRTRRRRCRPARTRSACVPLTPPATSARP